jgi:hypothetical protein
VSEKSSLASRFAIKISKKTSKSRFAEEYKEISFSVTFLVLFALINWKPKLFRRQKMNTQTRNMIVTAFTVMLAAVTVTGLFYSTCTAAEVDSLSKGLIMHLSFDTIKDVSGQKIIIDESGHENHGILLSGKIAEGKVGNALKCSAINKSDGVRVKDHDSLDLDAVTIVAWIKTEQIDGQWNRIVDKGWTESYNLCIGGDYKGKTWFRNRAQFECAKKGMTSKTPVVDNQWHLVVGTYDGQTRRIYIDHKLDIEKKLKEVVPMKHNNVDIMIGCLAVPEPNPYEHAFFDGLIDEVRLYNRVLSSEEVATLYKIKP